MIRVVLARLSAPLRWSSPRRSARLFMAFARAERSSAYDLLAAANHGASLERNALYLRHAGDESRHAHMFGLHAAELDPGVAGDPHQQHADFEHLFERLGEAAFLAFVHVGEARGRRQLALYRDELEHRGDRRGRALLDAVLVDEARHEAYTREQLVLVAGGERAARRALRRARLWELGRFALRAGRAFGDAVFACSMRALYLLCWPLALLLRLRKT